MEIVALYVPVLTGKTKSMPYGSTRLDVLSVLLQQNLSLYGLILDTGASILVT
jgi:hypothetical protein